MLEVFRLTWIMNTMLFFVYGGLAFSISDSNIISTVLNAKNESNVLLRPTWMEIDRDAIRSNVRQLKAFIGNNVSLMAVVKANAYGHGIIEISRVALESGATWLGVATLEEALMIRSELSKDVPILVLGYVPPEHLSVASRFRITVTGISLQWVQEADRLIQEPIDFHLKVDTGLNRLGCTRLDEVQAVFDIVSRNPYLKLSGVFTHFATSKELYGTSYFRKQLARFYKFLDIIPNRTEKIIHCANSGAVLYHAEKPFFNMVRCGTALLGPIYETLDYLLPIRLRTAMSVHSTIDLVKKIHAGDKVGYGAEYTATESQWIGTLPIGYVDGIHQYFKETGVLVGGKRFPIVGRISMDQLMIALDQEYPVGTRVTFIGRQGDEKITADDVARGAKLPKSEIFCSFSNRISRVYKDSEETGNSATMYHGTWHLLTLIACFSLKFQY